MNVVSGGDAGADTLAGGLGSDTASYRGSTAGVSVNLRTGATAGGDATGDVLNSIENVTGSKVGVAFFVACYSALRKAPVAPALLILGDMSVQGNIKPLHSLTEPLQVAKDNGAKRALIPIENKRNFLDVSSDIVEHVDPVFFGDPNIRRRLPKFSGLY